MKRPGKEDPSRPREDGDEYKRDFYRSDSVAEDYDFHRFSTRSGRTQHAQMGRYPQGAGANHGRAHHPHLPCGTAGSPRARA